MRKIAPYGSWGSPITADSLLKSSFGLGQTCVDGDVLYWLESRPHEGGRLVIVKAGPEGSVIEVTPSGFNVRSQVHEYGGGAYLVADGVVYFQNFADQQLYRQEVGGAPTMLYGVAQHRHADLCLDRSRNRLLAVREDHTEEGVQAKASLVAIGMDGSSQVLVEGADFYSDPRLSPDGSRLAWISWVHPNMPWDGTDLWVADVALDGSLGEARHVAGGPTESVVQPLWSPEGALHFISDRTGWWNLYQESGSGIEALCPMAAEFAGPQWIFGLTNYDFVGRVQIACSFTSEGVWHLGLLDRASRQLRQVALPYTEIDYGPKVVGGALAFIAGSPTESGQVVQVSPLDQVTVLRSTGTDAVDKGYLSLPESLAFPTTGGETAYGLFYPPQNPEYQALAGERPPLMVLSHGGPTGSASSSLSLGSIQFWTSRGFAILDVNYGGSTGYGRPYRDRLKGNWGVVDVDDCVNGARYLAEQGLVDGDRMVISGGSAGGYTTLCALTFHDRFRAGASHFGIGDLSLLAADTHKFESRYADLLVGPYPEAAELYRQRSPLHHADQISCPVIFFQGLEDRVVPPNQAETMVEALRERGVPVAYLAYEGEGHGFRQAANIKRTLDAELYFYGRVLGFTPADPIEPVTIHNF